MAKSVHARILLAEDNPSDVMLVREAAAEHGLDCDLIVMRDGEAAVQFLEQWEAEGRDAGADLVMLDLHLPKVDGEAILERLRGSAAGRDVPVIVMSASDSKAEMQTVEGHGAAYFRKPADLEGFLKIGKLMKRMLAERLNVGSMADQSMEE